MSPIHRLFAFAIAASASPPVSASTLHVPKVHTSIQTAIDAAGPGDRIEIAAGAYRESLAIPAAKTGLRLVGKGQVLLDQYSTSDVAKFGIVSSADGARIEWLTVIHTGVGNTSAATRGVLAHGAETVLSRIAVISGGACAIEVTGAGSPVDRCSASDSTVGIQRSGTDAVLARCTVSGAVSFDISANADRARVTDCRVRGVAETGFAVNAEDAVEIRGNAIRRTGSFGSTGAQLALGAYTGEAIENAGAASLLIGNSMKGNRLDLANEGSFAAFADNQFESGGDEAPPELD